MREDIYVSSITQEPIAILPEDNDALHEVLCKNLSEGQANAILKDGTWTSKNGCVCFYVEFIDDWRK